MEDDHGSSAVAEARLNLSACIRALVRFRASAGIPPAGWRGQASLPR